MRENLGGYHLFYRILDAADYGVPQHRERLIIVGLKEGIFKFPRPTHGPDSLDEEPFYNAEIAIEGVLSRESDESNRLSGRYAQLLDNIPPGLNYSFYTEEMGHPNPLFAWRSKFSDFLYKADPNTPVRTIKASGGAYTGPLHWDNRFFNYEEYKRLQTFPDDYEISGSKQIAVKQIGNSVPPQLARIMAIAIREQVFGTKFPFEISLLEESEQLSFRKNKRDLTEAYRKKAAKAIKTINKGPGFLPCSRNYYCHIDANFGFQEEQQNKSNYFVEIGWDYTLTVKIHDRKLKREPTTTVTIVPRDGKWMLGVKSVNLLIYSNEDLAFTVAWKAFEYELKKNEIKADLIQLSGYYQYPPKLQSICHCDDSVNFGSVIESVVSNKDVPEIKTTSQLSQEWSLGENDVILAAEYLKSIGYEVRNHFTNPQISEGNWLIPYSFPTLTPLSVQLRKKLS